LVLCNVFKLSFVGFISNTISMFIKIQTTLFLRNQNTRNTCCIPRFGLF
jgi:hypothetical protein